ncbi:hypothetical protein BY996DRAFT_8479425 [Phakopsora pachyrhizi]|nr:hypothetical protein BY996DRAFT_8479425 [Phakopsora pachyrhizi]
MMSDDNIAGMGTGQGRAGWGLAWLCWAGSWAGWAGKGRQGQAGARLGHRAGYWEVRVGRAGKGRLGLGLALLGWVLGRQDRQGLGLALLGWVLGRLGWQGKARTGWGLAWLCWAGKGRHRAGWGSAGYWAGYWAVRVGKGLAWLCWAGSWAGWAGKGRHRAGWGLAGYWAGKGRLGWDEIIRSDDGLVGSRGVETEVLVNFSGFEDAGVTVGGDGWCHWKEEEKLSGGAHQGKSYWSRITGATGL